MDHDSDWQEDDEGALHSSDSNEVEMESQSSDESEIIMQLKEIQFYSETTREAENPVLPKSWTLKNKLCRCLWLASI